MGIERSPKAKEFAAVLMIAVVALTTANAIQAQQTEGHPIPAPTSAPSRARLPFVPMTPGGRQWDEARGATPTGAKRIQIRAQSADGVDEGNAGEQGHPIDPALALIRQCQQRFTNVRDYTCVFVKEERIGNALSPPTTIEAKFRVEPFSVYFRWMQPDAGKEAIFVDGQFDNRIVSHSTGFTKALTGTVKLDPDGSIARRDSRHSIREAGIGNLISQMITNFEFERRLNETELVRSHVKINGRPCLLLHVTHPHPDTGKFMFHTFKAYIDKELLLPVRVEGYGFPQVVGREPGPLVECYTYLDLRVNTGLTDIDFSPRNPTYQFGRF